MKAHIRGLFLNLKGRAMKKKQKIDYKAKFKNLHAEYKKLQELLLDNQKFADNLKKELEKLKNENIEQSCKIIELLLNEKDSQNA